MADSLALFRQLGMQPIQTVQAAEPIAIGNVRPALAVGRYPAAVGAPAHRPYQYDAHNLLQEHFGATTTRVILRQKRPAPSLWKTQQFCACAAVLAFLAAWSGEQWTLTRLRAEVDPSVVGLIHIHPGRCPSCAHRSAQSSARLALRLATTV